MNRRILMFGFLLFACVWLMLFPSRMFVPPAETFSHDPGEYTRAAVHLAQEGFYSQDGVHPFFDREPGYSVFLAALYLLFGMENRAAIFLLQGMLTFLAAVLLHQEVRRFAGERSATISFLLLLALPSVYHTVFSAYRENVALILMMVFAASYLRFERRPSWRQAGLAGTLLGMAVLTYIPFLFLPFAVFFYARLCRPRHHAFLILLLPLFIVFLWGMRNYSHTGNFSIAAGDRSVIMWHVRGEQAEQLRGLEPLRCLWAEYISRDWAGRSSACSFNGVRHALEAGPLLRENSAFVAAEGQRKILRHFPQYLWFSLVEILELHLPLVNGWGFWYNVLAAVGMVIVYLGVLLSRPFVFRREYAVFFVLILYSAAIYGLTDATPRYLLPIIFCYTVLAGTGYATLMRRFSSRS